MTLEQLIEYIVQQLADGFAEEEIKKSLRAAGWDDGVLQEAFEAAVRTISARTAPPSQGAHLLETIAPLSFSERMVKRAIIAGIFAGLLILFGLLVFTVLKRG